MVDTPLLNNINSPHDLRQLPQEQLPQVCRDIREFLIDSLSQNPGHFASSMGAVELTVALHYVFNTPYDRIVWDVGHQAYGHKLLTGRRDRFAQNRKLGGLCGFPNPNESEYDTFAAGHASNSISAALGMAIASQLKEESPRRNVVAVIGDASISGGLAFEGINNAANNKNNLLIILNDNNMSIDRNVGSLNSYLGHITTSKGYNRLRYKAYNSLKRHNLISEKLRGKVLRFNNSLKSLLSSKQNIFEGLNVRYFGPFDGHDLNRIIKVLREVKDMEGPRIIHLCTVKGKGYQPAEDDPASWHAPGKFNPKTGERRVTEDANSPLKYQDVFGYTLLELAQKNNSIVGITAAMPSGTSMSIMQEAMPERVFDVGISEGHAVTFAGGLAKDGLRPYCAIYSSFLQRAYDHIIHDVALMHLPVTFCIDRAGLVGEDGATHHGALDLAYMRAVPGMIVSSPRDEHSLRNLLYTTQCDNYGPFAIRYPRGSGHNPQWKNDMQKVEIGRGEKLKDGNDVAVLSLGPIAHEVSQAIKSIEETQEISVAHYDMVFLKPIDEQILAEVAQKQVPIITVEDGAKSGGLASAVTEWLNLHGYNSKVYPIGIPDEFIEQGTVKELYERCGMDAASISQVIIRAKNENK
ncbi:MAG: 1-deoxy-D-xylulose-5-phosphate synthase [Muribaculaceae bacterium]|nr:1-deoxy-D-xylulose-5-phosphate synthase [Muribaculaceae bacterium]